MNAPVVNGLWIGNTLSPMERLTIRSFSDHGYRFRLWAYDAISDLPDGLMLEDANAILHRDELFSYREANIFGHGKGSFAGFSDLFRYKLLYEKGGIWVDMDMTCLAPLNHHQPYGFRKHRHLGAVGNYLECPPQSDWMKWCYDTAKSCMNAENTDWLLPIRILNEGIEQFGLKEYVLTETNDDEFPVVARMLRQPGPLPGEWKVLHWLNEEFRRIGLRKDACLEHSILHQLYQRHGVPVEVLRGREARDYRRKTLRFYYLWLNLQARSQWYLQKARGMTGFTKQTAL